MLKSNYRIIACGVLCAVAAQAATINTTLTVTNASGELTSASASFSGPATLTNIGSGTFKGTVSASSASAAFATGPYTITMSNGTDTLTGVASVPLSVLVSKTSFGSGSATV